MIAYIGQTRSRVLIARLATLGLGELLVRGELPACRRPFAFDNGCYRDWRAGVPFNVTRWTRELRWMLYRDIVPDFVVVPDIVAGGLASLEWSAFWRTSVPTEFAAYLAVQDGIGGGHVVLGCLRRDIVQERIHDRDGISCRSSASAFAFVLHGA